MVGEQPYKNRDMVGSDSGLGGLLVIVIKIFVPLGFINLVVRFRSSDPVSLFQIHSKKMILLFGEELADPILTEKIKVRPIKVRPIKVTISLKTTSSIASIENFDPLAIGIPRKFFLGFFNRPS